MALGEFDLIDRYFRSAQSPDRRRGIVLGIGDDAALLEPRPGQQLVAALDTLVEGRHFPHGSAPRSIGHRALAVNLSDLAAMGATPAWYLLALTLPAVDEKFLGEFASGMMDLAREHDVALVGGDTTAGPLSISVQVLGHVPPGAALLRSGAQPGDLLFVSGWPGEAAAGLQLEMGSARVSPDASDADASATRLRQRFLFPEPRVALGVALRGLASACIDISDGLAGDAHKIAVASGCGVAIEAQKALVSPALEATLGREAAMRAVLTGGDDYELCFTVPANRLAELAHALINVKCPVTCIGVMEAQPGLRVRDQGLAVTFPVHAFEHFVT
ncbi:MAG: thiamine-phosphate kinase [Pseudomonadota bacterium]